MMRTMVVNTYIIQTIVARHRTVVQVSLIAILLVQLVQALMMINHQ